jgi:hypothetical protein
VDDPPNPNEELAGPVRSGRIIAFVHRNRFRGQLDDGTTIEAVMPSELLPAFDPNVRLTIVTRQSVQVEMREPPALPKIVHIRPSGFCGPGY